MNDLQLIPSERWRGVAAGITALLSAAAMGTLTAAPPAVRNAPAAQLIAGFGPAVVLLVAWARFVRGRVAAPGASWSLAGTYLFLAVTLGGVLWLATRHMTPSGRLGGSVLLITLALFPGLGGTWPHRVIFLVWLFGEDLARDITGAAPNYLYAGFLVALGGLTLAWGLRQRPDTRSSFSDSEVPKATSAGG